MLPAAWCAPETVAADSARTISFNHHWRFLKGEAPGAEAPDFDDSRWRELALPHDWAIEGPFDVNFGANTGGLPVAGTGWYRKAFVVAETAKGRFFGIRFDGAMSNSHVWLNGVEIGGRPYGYSSFELDLTPHLRFGSQANLIAVRLTPEERSSRWYPGAGIYRNVWLEITGPVAVAPWGVQVTTPEITRDKATVSVKVELRNRSDREQRVEAKVSIVDPGGRSAVRGTANAVIAAGSSTNAEVRVNVLRPELWDLDHPVLYSAVVETAGASVATPFGIRTAVFSKDDGFLLNGRAVKFQGVCGHADLGALGMAVNRRAIERQLQILKAAGVNALRTSHNPPAPELLDAADRMGLLVIDEAYDMWRIPKVPNGSAKFFDEWHERDVRDFVRRDRNHPSVILWSIGNEIPEQGRTNGWETAKMLAALVRAEDPTRKTTAAFDNWQGAIRNELADQVDVQGFNYKPNHYEEILKGHPNWMIYASESASTVSSRGVYHLPLDNYQKHESKQVTSYDVVAPNWAMPPDVEFAYQDRLPKQVLGEFVWTGFDYLGEPTPYSGGRGGGPNPDWPARSSYFGMVDLAGFPKDRYYLYQSRWTTKPMVHVLPHWNWERHEGQEIPVFAYSNADEVELFLNGKSLGRQKRFAEYEIPVGRNVDPSLKFTTKYRFVWQVPYQAGSLRAVGYRDGKTVATDEVRTAGAPARIRLTADRAAMRDEEDLSFVTVRVEDKDGNLCPLADNLVHFQLSGPLQLAAVDNGNAASEESFQAPQRKAFNGLALAIVRPASGKSGKGKLTASSEGLAPASIEIAAP
jgi:beta-galactosidase